MLKKLLIRIRPMENGQFYLTYEFGWGWRVYREPNLTEEQLQEKVKQLISGTIKNKFVK